MRERKYVRFRVDMYEDTKFKIIDRMSKRDLIHYVWNRIVVLAGKVNQYGDLYMSRNIPYTLETLAIEFNRNVDEIKAALDVLIELEMIEFTEDKIYRVKNFAKHQNIKVKENSKIKKKENEINCSKNKATGNYNETVKKLENEVNNSENNRAESAREKEKSLKTEISTWEEKGQIDNKASTNNEAQAFEFTKANSNLENKCHNESNLDKEKDEKNNVSQHNNSPVILEMKKSQYADKKGKKVNKKKIRDNIIEENKDDDFINIIGEENDDGLSCWLTEEDMKPKEGERVISEWAF